jgi:Tol biopolymer transport system component
MNRILGLLATFAVLGTAATAAWATPPGKNGGIMFRRYLDPAKTTGALFTMNPDGTGVKQVTRPGRGVVDQSNDWSPDGRKIVFERKVPCPAGGPKDGLDNTCDRVYVARSDGKELRLLVPCGFDVKKPFPGTCVGARTPAWSPDGSKIAFRYALSDDDYVDSYTTNIGIWIVNADGTGRRQVTQTTPGSSWDREPDWSPDGKKLVFVRDDLARKAEAVFTVNIDGTGLFQVTPWNLVAGTGPDWSPDGRWILVGAAPGVGANHVYKVRPDGTGLANLTKRRGGGYSYLSSTFSPDGKRVVSARTPGTGRDGAADIVVMNADGSNILQITKTRLWESSVDWGPRGS